MEFEVDIHDGAYKGRLHSHVFFIGCKTLTVQQKTYNDIHTTGKQNPRTSMPQNRSRALYGAAMRGFPTLAKEEQAYGRGIHCEGLFFGVGTKLWWKIPVGILRFVKWTARLRTHPPSRRSFASHAPNVRQKTSILAFTTLCNPFQTQETWIHSPHSVVSTVQRIRQSLRPIDANSVKDPMCETVETTLCGELKTRRKRI